MRSSQILEGKRHLTELHGPWTAHNIELAEGIFTDADPEPRVKEPLFSWALQTAMHTLKRPISSMKVLDLGALEGGFAIEFARHGAACIGVEARTPSIEKARFAANARGLRNVQFVQEDVRRLDVSSFGTFDVVLCWGLLYHLDAPACFDLLANLRHMCTGTLIIDTHVSLSPQAKVEYGGHVYWGKHYVEHRPDADEATKAANLWASVDNCTSFWPTRPSLFNFLTRLGFSSVFESTSPLLSRNSIDRVNITVLSGSALKAFPQGIGTEPVMPVWREDEPRFCLDAASYERAGN